VNRMIRRLFRAAGAYHSSTGLLADVARVLLYVPSDLSFNRQGYTIKEPLPAGTALIDAAQNSQ